jgi:hypothetical protein
LKKRFSETWRRDSQRLGKYGRRSSRTHADSFLQGGYNLFFTTPPLRISSFNMCLILPCYLSTFVQGCCSLVTGLFSGPRHDLPPAPTFYHPPTINKTGTYPGAWIPPENRMREMGMQRRAVSTISSRLPGDSTSQRPCDCTASQITAMEQVGSGYF